MVQHLLVSVYFAVILFVVFLLQVLTLIVLIDRALLLLLLFVTGLFTDTSDRSVFLLFVVPRGRLSRLMSVSNSR